MRYPLLAFAAGLVALSGARAGALQNDQGRSAHVTTSKPTLEMVFAIDTTGSMGGLIDGARRSVWAIVNDIMKSPKRPAVRIGLVAYRDHGDVYVTRVLPLTSDLDQVYATLMAYTADGGGDEPEDVRQAMADALNKAGWSPRSPRIAQVLFLVGDSPPHTDYSDEPDVLDTTAGAVRRGITVNTIQCGRTESTRQVWQQIARRGEGENFAIPQDGAVARIASPYDKEMADLGAKLGRTYGGYGFGGGAAGTRARSEAAAKHMAAEGAFAAAAPASALADRAFNKALNADAYRNDLYQGLENGTLKLTELKADQLPKELIGLPVGKRNAAIAKTLAQRKTYRARIMELQRKREAYCAEERSKIKAPAAGTFDASVRKALRRQIAQHGIAL